MGKQRFLIAVAMLSLFTGSTAIAKDYSSNPFEKAVEIDISKNAEWAVKDQAATRTGSESGTWYHLLYDKKQLRLRITEKPEDSLAAAKQYDQFQVEDVLLDGKRLPEFQWCLNNQERHSRFLQQGLKVSKDVCVNQGDQGTFTMRMNAATLDALKKAKKLTFTLRPYRTVVNVNFDISDFSSMEASLGGGAVEEKEEPQKAVAAKPVEKCQVNPPEGFSTIKVAEYICNDGRDKIRAETAMTKAVEKEREHRKQVAAEEEKKHLAAEEARKQALARKKAEEERIAAEKAALAASAAQQEAINTEITNKMIAVCQKKWAAGEHRCYCEKYIEFAPPGIQSNPACAGE